MNTPNSNNLDTLVEKALADPMAAAQEARRDEGARVIGYLGADVPVELIAAADARPLALSGEPAWPCTQSQRYMESSFEPVVRAVAEQWLTGALDFLDAVVLPRSNDSSQRLYYYLCEIERRNPGGSHPRPLLFDLAKIPRASSRAHSLAATAELARALGADRKRLPAAIAARNRLRTLLARLEGVRRGAHPPSGALAARVCRAIDRVPAEAYVEALEQWLLSPPQTLPGVRVLLAGSVPPDERLHEAVESAGGCVVAEHGEHAVTRLGAPIEPVDGDDPLVALANHYHALELGARAFSNQYASVAQRLGEHGVDAGVVWLIEEDEAAVWDLPAQCRAFAHAGVPVLTLTRRTWNTDDGALDEIASFMTGVSGT